MKVIIGTPIVPTTLFIILFVELGILLTSLPHSAYAQISENEIIANTLETVEKATPGISEITESLNNASELIERSAQNTTESTENNTPSDGSKQYYQSEFKDSNKNWINGESDKLSFKYPSNWDVDISDSRFDNYEFIFTDKTSKSSIRISDEAIKFYL